MTRKNMAVLERGLAEAIQPGDDYGLIRHHGMPRNFNPVVLRTFAQAPREAPVEAAMEAGPAQEDSETDEPDDLFGDYADDLEDHSQKLMDHSKNLAEHSKSLAEHSRKAKKLAEVIRTTKVTRKVAGRTVPNSTHYTQTVTRKSDVPFHKS